MNVSKKIILLYFLGASCVYSSTVFAEEKLRLSLGTHITYSQWVGNDQEKGANNSRVSYDFDDSTETTSLGLSIAIQKGDFYTGLSYQTGDYKFDGRAPNQITSSTVQTTNNVTITQSEIDLVAGYYFWETVSVFIDIKTISNEWSNNNYEQEFLGFGVGFAGVWSLDNNWSLYGKYGVIPKGNVKANGKTVGDGLAEAMSFGAVYSINRNNLINFGLQAKSQEYEFDSDLTQQHDQVGFLFAYRYIFTL